MPTVDALLRFIRAHGLKAWANDDGTIICGTSRPQDLIPTFLSELRVRDSAAYAQIGAVPAYVQDEGDSSEWWDSEEASELLEALFEALDNTAPEGHYFGAHPGDGCDYGFWPIED